MTVLSLKAQDFNNFKCNRLTIRLVFSRIVQIVWNKAHCLDNLKKYSYVPLKTNFEQGYSVSLYLGGMEVDFNFHCRGCQIPASLPPIRAG